MRLKTIQWDNDSTYLVGHLGGFKGYLGFTHADYYSGVPGPFKTLAEDFSMWGSKKR